MTSFNLAIVAILSVTMVIGTVIVYFVLPFVAKTIMEFAPCAPFFIESGIVIAPFSTVSFSSLKVAPVIVPPARSGSSPRSRVNEVFSPVESFNITSCALLNVFCSFTSSTFTVKATFTLLPSLTENSTTNVAVLLYIFSVTN